MIDFSKLKRNPALYSTVLNDTGKSQLVAKVPCQVHRLSYRTVDYGKTSHGAE